MNKLDYVILDMIESSARTIRAAPLNLGGVPGSGGGEGAPPGGFVGWLPQTRVAYDTDELEVNTLPSGPSLLDNLNRIRYRLGVIESGGFGGDGTYLRLDTNNNPLTNQLQIINDLPGSGGVYIQTHGDAYTADFEQYGYGTDVVSSPVLFMYRAPGDSGASQYTGPMLDIWQVEGTGTITADFIRLKFNGSTKFNVDKDGNAYSNGTILVTDATSDGQQYARKDGAWVVVSGGGGTSASGQYRQFIYATNVISDVPNQETLQIEGRLAIASGVGGSIIVPISSGVIGSVYAYVDTVGTSGSTILDVNLNGVTIFTDQSQRPTIDYTSVTKKVEAFPAISGIVKGDIIRVDIDSFATYAADLTVCVLMYPTKPFDFITVSGSPVTTLTDLE